MAAEDVCMTEMDSSTTWLVERARQSLRENNPYEAKAWLITAKTLYPKDFGIQVRSLVIQVPFKEIAIALISVFPPLRTNRILQG